LPYSSSPTIESVRKLAKLVALQVSISDVHMTELRGYTGAIRMVLLVKGEVEIATDLSQARFEAVDTTQHHAVLILPAPTAGSPRLDHERTRIYQIDRTGLWALIPGQAGEAKLTNQCFQEAQSLLVEASQDAKLADQARSHCEQVLQGFFEALQWHVEVKWADNKPARADSWDAADAANG
jgi:hypothetical protein